MPMTIAIIVLIAAIAGFVGVCLIDAFRPDPATRKAPHGELRDPATCDHEWKTWNSGTCMTGYSSYGGPDPQEEWSVEYCPLCGAKAFSCSGSCDCYSECAAAYEGSEQLYE